MEMILFMFQVGYLGGMIGKNTGEVLFLFLIVIFVLGRSYVISLRGSYTDDFSCPCSCSRKVTGDSSERDLYLQL